MSHSHDDIFLINSFPDFTAPGFDIDRYNSLFVENNVIINARSSHVRYEEHWGPLSLKFAFGGREQYRIKNKTLSVDDQRFLIINEGRYYSSSIRSENTVESFTINFSQSFVRSAVSSFRNTVEDHLEQRESHERAGPHFEEQLYPHDPRLYRSVLLLRRLSLSPNAHTQRILEVFYEILAVMVSLHSKVGKKMNDMSPVKGSTKRELYRRLCAAQDFMYSCYDQPLTLKQISDVACLAPEYFLRQFKKNIGSTPHQFLTERRLLKASELLRKKSFSVSRACTDVGFDDVSSFSRLYKKRFGYSPSNTS